MTVMLRTRSLAKSFTLHLRGDMPMPVLSDQVLDDPRHPYTQLLVNSVLNA